MEGLYGPLISHKYGQSGCSTPPEQTLGRAAATVVRIRQLLLRNKLPPNSHNKHPAPYGFCGSGVWEQLGKQALLWPR